MSTNLRGCVDFFSIGTNDLTQYVLAADRDNPELAQLQDALHPAVLRLISQVIITAHKYDRHVGVCGEAASDPAAARLLVGLSVDELSLTPTLIPKIKEVIRAISPNARCRSSPRMRRNSRQLRKCGHFRVPHSAGGARFAAARTFKGEAPPCRRLAFALAKGTSLCPMA